MASGFHAASASLGTYPLSNGPGNHGFAGRGCESNSTRLIKVTDMLIKTAMSGLGTPHAPFLNRCPMDDASPHCSWGNMNATNTNPYTTRPHTGTTRTYEFVVTKETAAPDGIDTELLLVNSQFPGPLVECDWGDSLESKCHRSLSATDRQD